MFHIPAAGGFTQISGRGGNLWRIIIMRLGKSGRHFSSSLLSPIKRSSRSKFNCGHWVGGGTKRASSSLSQYGGYTPRFQDAPAEGYIVLLPDVPNDSPSTNSLLRSTDIPKFNELTKTSFRNALLKLALDLEAKIWELDDRLEHPESGSEEKGGTLRSFKILEEIEKVSTPLEIVWSWLKTLNIVQNHFISNDGFVQLHERARQARTSKYMNLAIHNLCKELAEDNTSYNEPQRRAINRHLLEGQLSGLELTGKKLEMFNDTVNKLAQSKIKYKFNVQASTVAFKHLVIDPKHVGDMPKDKLRLLAKDPLEPGKGPWVVTLSEPNYENFMQYCPERALRWNAWQAHEIRASSMAGNRNFNNSILIEEIRNYRYDQAKHLGFNNYVEMSMLTKMAGNVENVRSMLASCLVCAHPKQAQELESLQGFASSRGFEHQLKAWDLQYWRRKQVKSLYNVDETALQDYFPFPHVWSTLCSFVEQLFGISIENVTKRSDPLWHPDAQLFNVHSGGRLAGSFFVDPYERPGQKLQTSNGWMLGNRNRCDQLGHTTLATIAFNFKPPMYGKPSCLSFEDVVVLFEKFGQMLQHVLTEVPYVEVAGTNNVEWDVIQVPSKFMSLWLENAGLVRALTSHHDTGEKLSEASVLSLIKSRKHCAATDLCKQLYLSSLDLELYSSTDYWLDVARNQWKIYRSPLEYEKEDNHPCFFNSIFSGDFAAAYYSTLWSRMLAADIFKSFVENELQESSANETTDLPLSAHLAKLGKRFRSSYLELGGGIHPNETFRRFRGRDPNPNALLWSLGLKSMEDVIESETGSIAQESGNEDSKKEAISNTPLSQRA